MLSIKHIETSGHATVMEARRVTSQTILEQDKESLAAALTDEAAKNVPCLMDYGKREVFVENEVGDVHSYSTGVIYVMNSSGQTIDRHFLGEDGRGNVTPKA